MELALLSIVLVLVAFLTAVIDIMFGMGFGLTMTPILLALGFLPHQIVPALLVSSTIGNVLSSYSNHRLGNADFRVGSRDFRIVMVVGAVGVVGSFLGGFFAASIPDTVLGVYIGLLIIACGFVILLKTAGEARFTWGRVAALSLFGSFNKGVSGSGFGPILTTGILLLGIREKAAVSIQSFSELFVSIGGFLGFLIASSQVDWHLTVYTSLGVGLSAPLAAYVVSRLESRRLRSIIGIITIVLGLLTFLMFLI